MRQFTTVAGLRCYLDRCRSGQQPVAEQEAVISPPGQPRKMTVGLVPTMGALHAGHLSLIQRARQESDLVVVSIFVNPLQFGPQEDFQNYPRSLEQDQQLCREVGVDVIFAPSAEELYGKAYDSRGYQNLDLRLLTARTPARDSLTQVVPPAAMTQELCGRSRSGHFQGVATVVTKLLNIVQPQRAYFGQKDAQQLAILRRVVADLNLPVEIVGCPIVREASGLALSSRNQYLTPEQRLQSTALYRSLQQAEQVFQQGKRSRGDLISAVKTALETAPAVELEYVDLVHPDTMEPLEQIEEAGLLALAARVNSTRLIDNVVLRYRQPILAIDGPAGAGKSTVVRQVAQKLRLLYLDTGAMYRAVTWLVLRSGVPINDEAAVAELVSQCEIDISGDPTRMSVYINGEDVTRVIRSLEVTAQVSAIAAQPAVRRELVKRQQAYGRRGGIVMDGRDIGTHVFPDAELKIYLTASVQERARRRQQDLQNQGQPQISLEALEQSIYERDLKDSTRRFAPLRKADDAIEIQTDDLTIDEVVAKIIGLYREKLAQGAPASIGRVNPEQSAGLTLL